MKQLIKKLLKGDRRAAAQLISLAENDAKQAVSLEKALQAHTGKAHVIGVTGAPGTGKSTLIHGLIGHLRKTGKKVGVLANDPTSPITGGALLGDRIRMQGYSGDEGVFIRSMATRKGTGGLSPAAQLATAILDALGVDVIFIETTGVGQSETAVRDVVQSVVVVLTPQLGDEVQMMKAGVMEIGDIFVVNKGDAKNAARTADELETVLESAARGRKKPAIIVTTATEGKGLERLLDALEKARESMKRA
jgi:LAO/AO transport system kinase